MNNFIEFQKTRDNLSLDDYIYLINQYNNLNEEISVLYKKNINMKSDIKELKTTMKVLKRHNMNIPIELNKMYEYLKEKLNESTSVYKSFHKLLYDISDLAGIRNLRYVVNTISRKDNKSLEELSLLAGLYPNKLRNLIEFEHINSDDIQKFAQFYDINKVCDCWSQYIK